MPYTDASRTGLLLDVDVVFGELSKRPGEPRPDHFGAYVGPISPADSNNPAVPIAPSRVARNLVAADNLFDFADSVFPALPSPCICGIAGLPSFRSIDAMEAKADISDIQGVPIDNPDFRGRCDRSR